MRTVPDLIAAFGGPTAFSKVIGKRPSTASEMKRNCSIPVDYWPAIIAAAAEKGMKDVSADLLMRIHADAPPSPAAGCDQARGAA